MPILRSSRVARRLWLATAILLSPIATHSGFAGPGTSLVRVTGLAAGRVLWIRAKPSASAKRIGFLPSTARHIRSQGCGRSVASGWCKVHYRGTHGWVFKRYLKPDDRRRA